MSDQLPRETLRDAIADLIRRMGESHCWPEAVPASSPREIASEILRGFDVRDHPADELRAEGLLAAVSGRVTPTREDAARLLRETYDREYGANEWGAVVDALVAAGYLQLAEEPQ